MPSKVDQPASPEGLYGKDDSQYAKGKRDSSKQEQAPEGQKAFPSHGKFSSKGASGE